jgi:Holliday junction resolvase
VIKGSGNGRIKGDVRVPGLLRIECKTTRTGGYRVRWETIEKISEESIFAGAGEVPVIEVQLERTGSVYVVPAWAMEMLIDGSDRGVTLVERRTSKARSFLVTEGMVEKISEAALSAGELPAIEVQLDGTGSVCVMPTWAVEMLIARRLSQDVDALR